MSRAASRSSLLDPAQRWGQRVKRAHQQSLVVDHGGDFLDRHLAEPCLRAAMFALEGLGLGRAADLDPGVGRVFNPRPAETRAYRKAEIRQMALYEALILPRSPGRWPVGPEGTFL